MIADSSTSSVEPLGIPILFDGDDDAYQQWLCENPDGYVVNIRRNMDLSYIVLHRPTCRTIREYSSKMPAGAFTERAYLKVCARDLHSLRSWVRGTGRLDGSFSKECRLCQ